MWQSQSISSHRYTTTSTNMTVMSTLLIMSARCVNFFALFNSTYLEHFFLVEPPEGTRQGEISCYSSACNCQVAQGLSCKVNNTYCSLQCRQTLFKPTADFSKTALSCTERCRNKRYNKDFSPWNTAIITWRFWPKFILMQETYRPMVRNLSVFLLALYDWQNQTRINSESVQINRRYTPQIISLIRRELHSAG